MADVADTARRHQVREQGWFGRTLTLPFRFLWVMLLSLVVSIVFEWIGLAFFWSDQGWHHARDMMLTELDWISEDFADSLLVQEPGRTASAIVESSYKLAFIETGIVAFFSDHAGPGFPENLQSQLDAGMASAAAVSATLEDYALGTVFAILTFLVRLIVLVLTTPLFIMALALGLVDGLVRRDIRRFGAGLESGFIYHRARSTIKPLAIAPWIVYLSMPVSISPVLILLPCAAMLALSVSITVGSFKKYL